MESLTIDIAEELGENELLDFLRKVWKVNERGNIYVSAELNVRINSNTNYHYYYISNIKSVKGVPLEYPLLNIEDREKLVNNGIFVPSSFSDNLKEYINDGGIAKVRCELKLSSSLERTKHNNPFLLSVDPVTLQVLNKIHKEEVIEDDEGNMLIEQSLTNHFAKKGTKKINEAILAIEESYAEKKNVLKKSSDELSSSFEKMQVAYDKSVLELEKKEDDKRKEIAVLEGNRHQVILDIEDKKNNIEKLTINIEQLQKLLKSEEDIMGKKLDKLRAFIKDKAELLKNMEFIDEDEYNSLLMINTSTETDEESVCFENDLHSDKQKAISHIQAYLFADDIFYPRYILEDFFALIQTNDLIILAGESGSGKTNLIKSFAKAVGGKSFIIPVKPNWTSSEDLLGYYNPLEKKYLTTPFLEALLEAKDNPNIPYFICLDEMNLARVEYYFADFLSLLEERGKQPKITLYSEDESSYVNSEIKMVLSLIESTKDKFNKNKLNSFVELLEDKEINQELRRVFGFSDKDSLIKYHADLKRMLSGVLSTPASIVFPSNVRIVGAINIDETTHYLSPKILDRAHIIKFDSPLLQDWEKIENEIDRTIENKKLKIKFNIEDLGTRKDYPSFDRDDSFCKTITDMTRNYFSQIGIEVGLRTIRQGLNYQKIFIDQGSNKELVINNFILHKILPKMTFDGSKSIRENVTKKNVLLDFKVKLEAIINREDIRDKGIYVIDEISKIVENAGSNDEIVNYWA